MTGYMDAEGTRIEMDGAMNEDGSCTYTTHWKAAGKGSEDYIATLHPDNTGTYKSEDGKWTGVLCGLGLESVGW